MIQPDPENDGPDGVNLDDFNGDGAVDLFVNYEEGHYSRLYLNPGSDRVRQRWSTYVQFEHGQCEDSGIGDLDDDGDVDYVANGGWVYFNPGREHLLDASRWQKMTLFDREQRVPVVADVDGDGLNDLIVGAQAWYRQPVDGKHLAANWKRFPIGRNRWPMNCIRHDVDGDGDWDLVVPDRGVETCWYVNPGTDGLGEPWQRKRLHSHSEPMFMAVADLDGDQIEDFIITGGSRGKLARKLILLLRSNRLGDPAMDEVRIDQPSGGSFPKGVAVMNSGRSGGRPDILVLPKQGSPWVVTCLGNPRQAEDWQVTKLVIPGGETRKKMDQAWLGDLDNDGDPDVVTTEENGGWGVIWFENPASRSSAKPGQPTGQK